MKVVARTAAGHSRPRDAFALNSLPHTGMKRVCYEVKASRPDFLAELKHPLKRRTGMRYSNEFYFVTPAIYRDPGGVRAGGSRSRHGGRMEGADPAAGRVFQLDLDTRRYCTITVPAPWRDTPGPMWQLVAAMLRNQPRELGGEAARTASPATAHACIGPDAWWARLAPEGAPTGGA